MQARIIRNAERSVVDESSSCRYWLCWLGRSGPFGRGGNHVVCVDSDKKKIDGLKKGKIPIGWSKEGIERFISVLFR